MLFWLSLANHKTCSSLPFWIWLLWLGNSGFFPSFCSPSLPRFFSITFILKLPTLILSFFEGKMDTSFEINQSFSLWRVSSISCHQVDGTNYSSFLFKKSRFIPSGFTTSFLMLPRVCNLKKKGLFLLALFSLYIRTEMNYTFWGYLDVNRLWHYISKLIRLTFSMKEIFTNIKMCTSLCMLGSVGLFGRTVLTFGHCIIEGHL